MSVSQLGTVNGCILSMLTVSTGRRFRHSRQQQHILYNVITTLMHIRGDVLTAFWPVPSGGGGVGGGQPDLWKMVPSGVLLLYWVPSIGQPRVGFTDQVITALSIIKYLEHSEHNIPGMLDVTIVLSPWDRESQDFIYWLNHYKSQYQETAGSFWALWILASCVVLRAALVLLLCVRELMDWWISILKASWNVFSICACVLCMHMCTWS